MTEFRPEDIKDVPVEEVPDQASDILIRRARSYDIDTIEKLSDFDRLMKLDVMSRYAIFFAVADKSYGFSTEIARNRNIFLVDMLPSGKSAGWGGVTYSLTADTIYLSKKPAVIYTETPETLRGQGYGHRRYLAMNAASLLIYGYPLHSREKVRDHISDLAIRRWEALVREGLAEAYEEPVLYGDDILQRYRFKT